MEMNTNPSGIFFNIGWGILESDRGLVIKSSSSSFRNSHENNAEPHFLPLFLFGMVSIT
jgi:hypothetical protein